jgi:hypothetical protein
LDEGNKEYAVLDEGNKKKIAWEDEFFPLKKNTTRTHTREGSDFL